MYMDSKIMVMRLYIHCAVFYMDLTDLMVNCQKNILQNKEDTFERLVTKS